MANRVSKTWTTKGLEITKDMKCTADNLADYIVHMTEKDINYDFIMSLFGTFKGKSLCHPYDLLVVPPNSFHFIDEKGKERTNKNKFTTTIGLYLFNLIVADIGFSKLFEGYYINTTLNKKQFEKIEQRLSYALIEDDITTAQLKRWENTMQWFMPFEDVLSPNQTEKLLTCTKILNKKKAELLKKYKTEVENGDVATVENIEKELLNYAKEYLGDDPSMDTIDSGAGGKFGNNFKNLYVMKGVVANPDPNAKRKYDVVTSNYLDGVTADEYSIVAGTGAAGAYSRGKKTETGGYWEKLFVSAFQHISLDPKGSDCGTKRYITVEFNESNIIESNGNFTLLTSKNYQKYIGKKCKLRFSSMCESKTGICNRCAGELLYIGAANIGLVMSQIPATLKLRCMKAFHDSRINTTTIDPMKAFFPFK